MDFCIDKSFFGTPFYLKCLDNGKIQKLSEKPSGLLCVGDLEAWVVSKLYSFTIPRFPSYKYRRFFVQHHGAGEVPWEHVLPAAAYKQEIRETLKKLQAAFKGLNIDYYENCFKKQSEIFDDLQQAKIDVARFVDFLSCKEDKDHLKSFTPTSGFAQIPKYTRIGTRTGRLKIKKGPMILNLKKEQRSVLTSRFDKGSIWQLDYASLEPRILLAVNGTVDIPKDIYESVLEEFELSNVPRSAIKQAIISRLYGAKDYTIEKQLKHVVDYPADIISLVDDHFGIEALKQKLSLEFSINDGRAINNFYGRRIACEDTPLYVLLNYFIQSTGVDVCLFGFNKISSKIKQAEIQNKIVPLFILHDALFLDVHPEYEYLLPKLCRLGSTKLPGFEDVDFHLTATKGV